MKKALQSKSALMAALALAFAATNVLAHTEIKVPVLIEGTAGDNAITIGHGCETGPTTAPNAIVAQSVIFPQQDLTGVIDQLQLNGLIDTIQPGLFPTQAEKSDANGNVYGFSGRGGNLAPFSQGRVPFYFTTPNFAADSCVKKLTIQLAIADICKTTNPKIAVGKVNIWMPDYSAAPGPSNGIVAKAIAAGIDGPGAPPEIVVNRDLVNNPLLPGCGAGTDAVATPTVSEINANLPIPGYW